MMMAASGFLEIFMTRKGLGSLSEIPRNPTKPTKMVVEQENNFWKECERGYPSIKLMRDIFE